MMHERQLREMELACMSNWEWFKVVAAAFLISIAVDAAVLSIWLRLTK
jgi:hypothetical protein